MPKLANTRPSRLLLILLLLCLLPAQARCQQGDLDNSELLIGVYNDVGAGKSLQDLLRVLRGFDQVNYQELSAEDIRRGRLEEFDLLIHPGGSGSNQGNQLGSPGRKQIKTFVSEGGGFIGICAGAYLASADYSWSLGLLDAKVLDRKHWARGTGSVEIAVEESGQRIFGDAAQIDIFYGQGPLLAPKHDDDIPDYEALAVYQSEIAKNGAPSGVMIGTTAIARGSFGDGIVFGFSPHPEKTAGLEFMLRAAIDGCRRSRGPLAKPLLATQFTEAVANTPDISQKGMPNTEYCAPCSVANILCQFRNRDLLPRSLPDVDVADDTITQQQHSPEKQLALVLGDDSHMETLSKNGTNRYRLVRGMDRLLRAIDSKPLLIEYLGVRSYDRGQLDKETRQRIQARVGIPQLDHLKNQLAQGSGVIILFGSYKPNPEQADRLERVGGHYVAAVGYGQDRDGTANPNSIILHDSNDRHAGQKIVVAKHTSSELELWSDDQLLTKSSRLVQLDNAPIRKDGRIAFLETIFSFSLSD